MVKLMDVLAWFLIALVYLGGLADGIVRSIWGAVGTIIVGGILGYLVGDVDGVKSVGDKRFNGTPAWQFVPAVTAVCVVIGLIISLFL